jgi:hypothetical protein
LISLFKVKFGINDLKIDDLPNRSDDANCERVGDDKKKEKSRTCNLLVHKVKQTHERQIRERKRKRKRKRKNIEIRIANKKNRNRVNVK